MSTNTAYDLLKELNPDQQRAVLTTSGPLLVLAGPGSGKTRLIVHRIAYLIREAGVRPEQVLALTFTNRAALEMKERLALTIPQAAWRITAGTFHSVCARWLRIDGQEIGVASNYSIYDVDEQVRLVKEALDELNIDRKRYSPGSVQAMISYAKNKSAGGPIQIPAGTMGLSGQTPQAIFDRYQKKLAEHRALDFDDLLLKAIELLHERSEIREKYRSRYVHLMVDEFQDTNAVQYRLLKLLAPSEGSICVVGDEDQSIYSWRNADLTNILNFPTDFGEVETLPLGQNYRSTPNIIEASAALISANRLRHGKRLWTENPPGDPVTVIECDSDEEEAEMIAAQIRKSRRLGIPLNDVAILYRTNAQSRILETTFAREGIPARVIGLRFFNRAEVRDIVAYLYTAFNPYDDAHLLRIINVPARAIGAKTVAGLRDYAERYGLSLSQALDRLFLDSDDKGQTAVAGLRGIEALRIFHQVIAGLRRKIEQDSPAEVVRYAVKESGYAGFINELPDSEDRLANLDQLLGMAHGYPGAGLEALAEFLQQVSLVSDADSYSKEADAVTLATFHGAKGLEFDLVFVTGLEEGLCPHTRSMYDMPQLEEERRLVYVGMTRARKRLFLSYAEMRRGGAGPMTFGPSRFLDELAGNVQTITARDLMRGATPGRVVKPVELKRPAPAARLEAPFRPADKVQHGKFGVGTVISCKPAGDDYEVEVVFATEGLKKLMQGFANLAKV